MTCDASRSWFNRSQAQLAERFSGPVALAITSCLIYQATVLFRIPFKDLGISLHKYATLRFFLLAFNVVKISEAYLRSVLVGGLRDSCLNSG